MFLIDSALCSVSLNFVQQWYLHQKTIDYCWDLNFEGYTRANEVTVQTWRGFVNKLLLSLVRRLEKEYWKVVLATETCYEKYIEPSRFCLSKLIRNFHSNFEHLPPFWQQKYEQTQRDPWFDGDYLNRKQLDTMKSLSVENNFNWNDLHSFQQCFQHYRLLEAIE